MSAPRAIVESYSNVSTTPTTAVGGSIESGTNPNTVNEDMFS